MSETRCLFVGRLRIRWAGDDFRPLPSERMGRTCWLTVGRVSVRWETVAERAAIRQINEHAAPAIQEEPPW